MAEREDKFRTHRIIQIDEDIRSGIYPGIQFLMDKHGVSRRTILRDIEFLRDRYQAPIECDRTRKGYYYTDPTFAIKNVLLTEGDTEQAKAELSKMTNKFSKPKLIIHIDKLPLTETGKPARAKAMELASRSSDSC